jgi:hypothetical protein
MAENYESKNGREYAFIWALTHRQWRLSALALAVVLGWLAVLREGWALALPPLAVWPLTGMIVGPLSRYLVGRSLPVPAAAGARRPRPARAGITQLLHMTAAFPWYR